MHNWRFYQYWQNLSKKSSYKKVKNLQYTKNMYVKIGVWTRQEVIKKSCAII